MAKASAVGLASLLFLCGGPLILAQQQPLNVSSSLPYVVTGKDVPRHLQVRQFFIVTLTRYEAEKSIDGTMSRLGLEGGKAEAALLSALQRFRDNSGFKFSVSPDNNGKISGELTPDGRLSSQQRALLLADIYVDLEESLVEAGFEYTALDDYIERRIAPFMASASDEPFDVSNRTVQSAFAFEERVGERRTGRGANQ